MGRRPGSITKSFTFEGKRYYVRGMTEKEALMKLAEKKASLEAGAVVRSKACTVRQWAYECLDTYKQFRTEKYESTYRNRMERCVLEYLGTMRMKDVKPIDCQKCLNQQSGKSVYQIRQTKQILSFIFDKAVDNDIILRSPARGLVMPQGTAEKRRALTAEEEKVFLSITDPKYLIFRIMYHCGLRPSEAREVKGNDIYLIDGHPVLHVRGTKTKNADRTVPIPSVLYEEIKDYSQSRFLCRSEAGNHIDDKCLQRKWHSLTRDMNIAMGCKVYRNELIPPFPLADDLVPYSLRHTYATNLLRKYNVDLRIVQKLMGHSDIRMTANVYTHIDTDMITGVGDILDGVVPAVAPIPKPLENSEEF